MVNLKDRIWVDGCFDFFHHGHAGALMQARQHGNELYVGVHSDAEIQKNKGPVVMHNDERLLAVEANKWSTHTVADAPYVTDPNVMDEYQCEYVVHGDDITTDANGNDSYQIVKDLGRFITVKRTPNISTTNLISRMLGSSSEHHLPPVTNANADHFLLQEVALDRLKAYATDKSAKLPHAAVCAFIDSAEIRQLVKPSEQVQAALAKKAYYVDGAFDLLHSGHLEFLKEVKARATKADALVVIGLYDDTTVQQANGGNFPIMNTFERSLSLLQTSYVDAIIIGAPFGVSPVFLSALEAGGIHVEQVVHGPTRIVSDEGRSTDRARPYAWAEQNGLLDTVGSGKYSDISAGTIVDRVLNQRRLYEERQRRKGAKTDNEKMLREVEMKAQTGSDSKVHWT